MIADEAPPEPTRHSSLVTRHSTRRRVYLMRHAEVSYFNAAGRPRRPRGVSLTAEGREQAAAAARALAPTPLDRVVISGLPRTVETARIVVGDRPLTPEVRPDLREIEGGRLRDVAEEQIEALFTRAFVRIDRATQFLGGETFGALVDRAVPAFRALCAEPGWRHLLIVAHGAVNRALLLDALDGGLGGFGAIEQDAACINIVDVEPDGDGLRTIVRLMNYTPYNELKRGLELTTMERLYRAYRPGAGGQRGE
jgi:probable phosphoglycerate mutase